MSVSGSPHISPVCLPENSREDYSGQTGLVTGWGVTQEGGAQLAQGLREVNVTVISLSDCRSVRTSGWREREEINKRNVTGGTSLTTTQTPSARPCCVRGRETGAGTVARETAAGLS